MCRDPFENVPFEAGVGWPFAVLIPNTPVMRGVAIGVCHKASRRRDVCSVPPVPIQTRERETAIERAG